ncbi:MAG: hypothetical protein R6U41_12050 [Desulfosalsimonas sp.]|uniref:hypothetical protein n=1 Tax=Desulfosalsimonas sp. TaxID=3073848 RepID=UPI0039706D3A
MRNPAPMNLIVMHIHITRKTVKPGLDPCIGIVGVFRVQRWIADDHLTAPARVE